MPELIGAIVGRPTTAADQMRDLATTVAVSTVLLAASAVVMSVIIHWISRWQQR